MNKNAQIDEILNRHREAMKKLVEEAKALGINFEKYMETK